MKYKDLREFIDHLSQLNEIITVEDHVKVKLEMTEFSKILLDNHGPACLFKQPILDNANKSDIKVLSNLFGTTKRIALALGLKDETEIRELGLKLAKLKNPNIPKNLSGILEFAGMFVSGFNMIPKVINTAPVHEVIIGKDDVNLQDLPIWTCHREDIAPLITWGLVVTKGPSQSRQNLGIYRQQVLSKNKVIMRWLSVRGGALDYKKHCQLFPDKPFPISVVLGCDPATILAAVLPIPDNISEYQFAGLLRKTRTELTNCILSDLQVPAYAEIVLEGFIYPNETALEGPFGDHTGYYNEQETFPVMTIETITHRNKPIYHSTFTGKPIDEPAVLGFALNELFVPIIQQQFPEIVDFYLPPEGCSYRIAIVSINKSYPGQAKKIMLGVWSFLNQFSYTKFIIIVDATINIRSWQDVMWAISTKVDPKRDSLILENTPIDYLDFASPVSGLGSKIGIDATDKIGAETTRNWGKEIISDPDVKEKMQKLYDKVFELKNVK